MVPPQPNSPSSVWGARTMTRLPLLMSRSLSSRLEPSQFRAPAPDFLPARADSASILPAMLRVCMLVANPITFDGRVIRHAQTLVEAGHQVTVLGVIGPNDTFVAPPGEWAFSTWRLDRRRRALLPRLTWAVTATRQRAALGL